MKYSIFTFSVFCLCSVAHSQRREDVNILFKNKIFDSSEPLPSGLLNVRRTSSVEKNLSNKPVSAKSLPSPMSDVDFYQDPDLTSSSSSEAPTTLPPSSSSETPTTSSSTSSSEAPTTSSSTSSSEAPTTSSSSSSSEAPTTLPPSSSSEAPSTSSSSSSSEAPTTSSSTSSSEAPTTSSSSSSSQAPTTTTISPSTTTEKGAAVSVFLSTSAFSFFLVVHLFYTLLLIW